MRGSPVSPVELENVEKRFGRVRALAGISAELPAGSLNLITGPNGAGKSTLLRVLAALTRPTRGSVRILGEELYRSTARSLRGRIGYLGPEPALYGELTVAENLAFCAQVAGAAAPRVERQLIAFELREVAERRVRTLSTGYRRRAGLARALLAEPKVLLLDEPWNGLDTDAADLLVRALTRVRQHGATVLVAAHAVGAYTGLFDHTLRLESGRLEPPGAA